MGRIIKAVSVIVLCALLTACTQPLEYDPTINYSSFSAPGIIPGGTPKPGSTYGNEAWGFDPSLYSGLTKEEAWIQYQQDQASYWSEYLENNSSSSSVETVVVPDIPEPEPSHIEPSFDNVTFLSHDDLIYYFGSRDSVGYFSSQYLEVYSDSGHIALLSDRTYSEAIELNNALYGPYDVEFIYEGRRECYWFTPSMVYTVATFLDCVTESQSPYCSEFEMIGDTSYAVWNLTTGVYKDMQPAYTLYKEYGKPYHEDFFNLIWKTDTKWYAFNRRTYAMSVTEV